MTLHPIPLNFPIYEENFILFFISVLTLVMDMHASKTLSTGLYKSQVHKQLNSPQTGPLNLSLKPLNPVILPNPDSSPHPPPHVCVVFAELECRSLTAAIFGHIFPHKPKIRPRNSKGTFLKVKQNKTLIKWLICSANSLILFLGQFIFMSTVNKQ